MFPYPPQVLKDILSETSPRGLGQNRDPGDKWPHQADPGRLGGLMDSRRTSQVRPGLCSVGTCRGEPPRHSLRSSFCSYGLPTSTPMASLPGQGSITNLEQKGPEPGSVGHLVGGRPRRAWHTAGPWPGPFQRNRTSDSPRSQ